MSLQWHRWLYFRLIGSFHPALNDMLAMNARRAWWDKLSRSNCVCSCKTSFDLLCRFIIVYITSQRSLHKAAVILVTGKRESSSYFRARERINNSNTKRPTEITTYTVVLTILWQKSRTYRKKRSAKHWNSPPYIRKEKESRKRRIVASFCSVAFYCIVFCQYLVRVDACKQPIMATGPTTNRPLTKTFCATCGQAFTPKDAMQIYQDKYYHPHCFCCASCGNTLAGKPFYPKPNNQFQCENCNHALAPMYDIHYFLQISNDRFAVF